MIKFVQKILGKIGMIYLYFLSIKELVNVMDLYLDNSSFINYSAKIFLNDFNKILNQNIQILNKVYDEVLNI